VTKEKADHFLVIFVNRIVDNIYGESFGRKGAESWVLLAVEGIFGKRW